METFRLNLKNYTLSIDLSEPRWEQIHCQDYNYQLLPYTNTLVPKKIGGYNWMHVYLQMLYTKNTAAELL